MGVCWRIGLSDDWSGDSLAELPVFEVGVGVGGGGVGIQLNLIINEVWIG